MRALGPSGRRLYQQIACTGENGCARLSAALWQWLDSSCGSSAGIAQHPAWGWGHNTLSMGSSAASMARSGRHFASSSDGLGSNGDAGQRPQPHGPKPPGSDAQPAGSPELHQPGPPGPGASRGAAPPQQPSLAGAMGARQRRGFLSTAAAAEQGDAGPHAAAAAAELGTPGTAVLDGTALPEHPQQRATGPLPGSREAIVAQLKAMFEGQPVDPELEELCHAVEELEALQQVSDDMGLPDLETILSFPNVDDLMNQRRKDQASEQQVVKRVQKLDAQGRAYATGRRKEATARVWLRPGSGVVMVNKRPLAEYFPLLRRIDVLAPFAVLGLVGQMDVRATVRGGGVTGQSQALRHGISRALEHYEPEWRWPLKAQGLMTRDPRVVERKKPGKAKARKSYQWVKR